MPGSWNWITPLTLAGNCPCLLPSPWSSSYFLASVPSHRNGSTLADQIHSRRESCPFTTRYWPISKERMPEECFRLAQSMPGFPSRTYTCSFEEPRLIPRFLSPLSFIVDCSVEVERAWENMYDFSGFEYRYTIIFKCKEHATFETQWFGHDSGHIRMRGREFLCEGSGNYKP